MSMVVQHNLTAMNSNRMLGITTSAQAKSSEKLSSGYKINRAADDAAGLTISEKMRKQMRGLERASTNAQDGVSAVQTAEGALTEVHSMLQRMNELAVQASNGTNSESDRDAIQAEIDQLTTEIDRVSETTKFNETYLLKGNTAGTMTEMKVNAHDAGIAGKLTDNGSTATFRLDSPLEDGSKIKIAGTEYTIGNGAADADGNYVVYDSTKEPATKKLQAGDSITYNDGTNDVTKTMVNKLAKSDVGSSATGDYKLTTAKSKFSIVDADGTRHDYEVKDAPAATDLNMVSAASAESMINAALENGAKVYLTADKNGNALDDIEVVKALGDDELGYGAWTKTGEDTLGTVTVDGTSVLDAAGANNTKAVSATIGGVTTTFTDNKPVKASEFESLMGKLKSGDAIQVTSASNVATVLVIADKTDVTKNEYTVEDAIKAVNKENDDIDKVEFAVQSTNKEGIKALKQMSIANGTVTAATSIAAAAFTAGTPAAGETAAISVVGNPSENSSGENVISANTAYTMIAEELQKASSIGTDNGKAATVTNVGDGSFTITKGTAAVKESLSFNLHVGADADMTNKIGVTIESMSTAGLGIKDLEVIAKDANGKSINDGGTAATYAIDAIADAISKVSAQRSALGAVQNRLEHTIANLDNVVENTTAAESRIRDTDMAKEMVEYSKNNILAQAGQSMLAQANQSNQGVLSLLQ